MNGAAAIDERRQKLARLRELLGESDLDALYVSEGVNIRYLTGFSGSLGHLLVTGEEAVLATDPRYEIRSAEETRGSGVETVILTREVLPKFVGLIAARGLRRIGFEAERLGYGAWETLQSGLSRRKPIATAGLIERMRQIKSPTEIEAIRRAVRVSSEAFERTCGRIRPSWTEQRFAAELDHAMRRLGAEGSAFDTIVASGAPRRVRIEPRSLVVVDMGAILDGYHSDMTRTLAMGRPSRSHQALYRAVLDAQLAAIEAVKPGIQARTVDGKARSVLRRSGYGKLFVHSTGHGVGLEVHELPYVSKHNDQRLEEGMVITIEPGAYMEGLGGARVEDIVVITRNGCETLTSNSKALRLL
jgi:Xaa-Pro aminopeptidase